MPVYKDTSTSHYAAKEQRRRGLQKTRFFCHSCQRQCLDQHGYDLHCKSETHILRHRRVVAENGGSVSKMVQNTSRAFHREMVSTLRRHHGYKPVSLNGLYQEHISVKGHTHLNATRWPSLTSYSRFLAKSGDANVWNRNETDDDEDDTPSNIMVAYVKKDNGNNNNNNNKNNNTGETTIDTPLDRVVVSTEELPLELPPAPAIAPAVEPPVPQQPLQTRGSVKFALKKKKK